MAALDLGKYHTNVGWVPAVVWHEKDGSGGEIADQSTNGDAVDVILLGFANGKRKDVPVGTDVNQFER